MHSSPYAAISIHLTQSLLYVIRSFARYQPVSVAVIIDIIASISSKCTDIKNAEWQTIWYVYFLWHAMVHRPRNHQWNAREHSKRFQNDIEKFLLTFVLLFRFFFFLFAMNKFKLKLWEIWHRYRWMKSRWWLQNTSWMARSLMRIYRNSVGGNCDGRYQIDWMAFEQSRAENNQFHSINYDIECF